MGLNLIFFLEDQAASPTCFSVEDCFISSPRPPLFSFFYVIFWLKGIDTLGCSVFLNSPQYTQFALPVLWFPGGPCCCSILRDRSTAAHISKICTSDPSTYGAAARDAKGEKAAASADAQILSHRDS